MEERVETKNQMTTLSKYKGLGAELMFGFWFVIGAILAGTVWSIVLKSL